jgi:V/A-type H+-transporting ATPase subunit E
MGIEDLVNNILKEAEEKAKKIKESAQREYVRILDEAKKEAEEKKELILKEKKEQIENQRTKIITQANIEKKRIILEAKNQIIDDVFRLVLERIDKEKIPKIKKIYKDKVIEEKLNEQDFFKDLKEKFRIELARFLNLDEKDI